MFFSSWGDVGRVAAVSALSFILIVTILRVVGQQALARMSGFDVVFTVTFGSIIANVVVQQKPTLVNGITALVTMLVLQEVIRRIQAKNLRFHHIVREVPRVVLWNGQMLEDRMVKIGVSGDEIRAAVRKAGYASIDEILAVVLENDGEWSVIEKRGDRSDHSALHGLQVPKRIELAPSETSSQSATPAPPDRIP